jgi:hypothetical protein
LQNGTILPFLGSFLTSSGKSSFRRDSRKICL